MDYLDIEGGYPLRGEARIQGSKNAALPILSGALLHSGVTVLKNCPDITVNEELEAVYRDWTAEHPFDKGAGWAQEPWCQEEMPVSKELAMKAAAQSDAAVVIIGRTAGEDKDNSAKEGSYLLTAQEKDMGKAGRKHMEIFFDKRIIVDSTIKNLK